MRRNRNDSVTIAVFPYPERNENGSARRCSIRWPHRFNAAIEKLQSFFFLQHRNGIGSCRLKRERKDSFYLHRMPLIDGGLELPFQDLIASRVAQPGVTGVKLVDFTHAATTVDTDCLQR